MPNDQPTPLASTAQFSKGAFADLAANLQNGALDDIMIEATRACEDIAKRRLALFSNLTETHRADGIDPDEYGSGSTNIPMDLPGTLGRSYASALGAGDLVRHVWLENYAPCYSEFWTNYTVSALTIIRSIGGTQNVAPTAVIGPESDTGHIWFPVGTYLPIGSLIRVTYSGGYTTVPASLVRACKAMAASIIVKELDPTMGGSSGHDPDTLRDEAVEFLDPYMKG